MLSEQVHPSDAHSEQTSARDTARTEAWAVIEAEQGSQIYAGLRPGMPASNLRRSLDDGTIADHLVSIVSQAGRGSFIPTGTVHTLGNDVVVFEVQQNSDDLSALRLGPHRPGDQEAAAAASRSGVCLHRVRIER